MKISIFVPAYNEEKNIKKTIDSIVDQKINGFIIEKIIIAISGDDSTKSIVESFNNEKIEIWYEPKRTTKVHFENMFFSLKTTSEILVGVDADCYIHNEYTIQSLLEYFKDGKQKLVCSNPVPINPTNFMEQVAYFGDTSWKKIRDCIRKKSPAYDCNGRLFAIASTIAHTITIPDTPADDMYIACQAQHLGYPIFFAEEAKIQYKLPGNLRDYTNQHMRYDKHTMKAYFSPEFLKQYKISGLAIAKILLLGCIKQPIIGTAYCVLRISIKFLSLFYTSTTVWKINSSTKKI